MGQIVRWMGSVAYSDGRMYTVSQKEMVGLYQTRLVCEFLTDFQKKTLLAESPENLR